MSLKLLKTVPAFGYYQHSEVTGNPPCNPDLAPPKLYAERLKPVGNGLHFFYEPSHDRLVAFAHFDFYWYPGYRVYRLEWDAETGALLQKTSLGTAGLWSLMYTTHCTMGSYRKIYATKNGTPEVCEVPWETIRPQSDWWKIRIDPLWFQDAIVNREDDGGLLVGTYGSSVYVDVFSLYPTPSLRTRLIAPDRINYGAWENRTYCWFITRTGGIIKLNYKLDRWELMTAVQNPSPDARAYYLTFDIKRNRLVVLRERPDLADGTPQSQLEFYTPLYQTAMLTDPVPLSLPRAGERTRFVVHLIGESGEGVTPYEVLAGLRAPVVGEILTPVASTQLNGAVTFRYEAPAAGTETMVLTSEVGQ